MIGRMRLYVYQRRFSVLPAVAALCALLLVGCAGTEGSLGAELSEDPPAPPISGAAAQRLVDKAVAAGERAVNSGQFTLTVTDEEATSFLNIGTALLSQLEAAPIEELDQIQGVPELEGIDLDRWRELLAQRERVPGLGSERIRLLPAIEDASVNFLGNGYIIVRGKARFLVAGSPFRLVTAPHAAQGELVLDFVEGRLGPMPMPEFLFDYLGQGLARALLAGQEYAEITEVRVADGVLTVSGRWNP